MPNKKRNNLSLASFTSSQNHNNPMNPIKHRDNIRRRAFWKLIMLWIIIWTITILMCLFGHK